MNTRRLLLSTVIFALVAVPAMAMQGNDKMDHGAHGMQMDQSGMGGMFKHHDSMDGMNADFQVMSLASMNMTSDKGETHHIMVNLSQTDGGAPIKDAVGKIKVVGPDGKEQVSTLKNYNGILAGNFTFKEPGKYGVICLLKNGDKKPVFKFWYEHME